MDMQGERTIEEAYAGGSGEMPEANESLAAIFRGSQQPGRCTGRHSTDGTCVPEQVSLLPIICIGTLLLPWGLSTLERLNSPIREASLIFLVR